MAEGRVYKVSWEQASDGWRVWLHDHPHIAATVPSLDDVWSALWQPVCSAFGDGEPQFALHPPAQPSDIDAPFLKRELGTLSNRAYAWIAGNAQDYFVGPLCEVCWRSPGGRTERPLVESSPPEGDLCHRNQSDFGCVIATERFVALLSRAEVDSLTVRPIVRGARTRRVVYEVIPKLILPPVAVLNWKVRGWKCGACGSSALSNDEPASALLTLVSDGAVEHGVPPIFGVGCVQNFDLAMPFARACELADHPQARGAAAFRIGTVPADLIDPAPLLPVCTTAAQFMPLSLEEQRSRNEEIRNRRPLT